MIDNKTTRTLIFSRPQIKIMAHSLYLKIISLIIPYSTILFLVILIVNLTILLLLES